jgi:hypothetical protein
MIRDGLIALVSYGIGVLIGFLVWGRKKKTVLDN